MITLPTHRMKCTMYVTQHGHMQLVLSNDFLSWRRNHIKSKFTSRNGSIKREQENRNGEEKTTRQKEVSTSAKTQMKGTQCDWRIILLSVRTRSKHSKIMCTLPQTPNSKWQSLHPFAILGNNTGEIISRWKLSTFNNYISIPGKSNEKHFRHTAHLHVLLLSKRYVAWMEIASETLYHLQRSHIS